MTAKYKLVGDIGGTNARFGLIDSGSLQPHSVTVFPCADYASFSDALKAFFAKFTDSEISEGGVAVGMPVVNDWLQMTNNHWSFSRSAVEQEFGFERLLFTNDFSALALSLPLLDANEVVAIGAGQFLADETIGVIGPGTGLGVSGLVRSRDGCWIALRGEGGHVSLAARNAREQQILARLATLFTHVSAERLLSGPGLCLLRKTLQHIDGVPEEDFSAAQITAAAVSASDEYSVEAVAIFCSQLGSVAGNLALTLGAEGGVYIGGGIVPRLGDFFHSSAFRSSFEQKGRMSRYLKGIGTCVVIAEYPALRGVATLLV